MNKIKDRIEKWSFAVIFSNVSKVLFMIGYNDGLASRIRQRIYNETHNDNTWVDLLEASQSFVNVISDCYGGNVVEFVETNHKSFNMSRKTLTREVMTAYAVVDFYRRYGDY